MVVPRRVVTRAAHPVAPDDLVAIRALHEIATAGDGHEALGEAVWRDLESGGQPGSAGVFAYGDAATDDRTYDGADDDGRAGDRLLGYTHVAPSDTFAPRHWALGRVVHPDARDGSVEDALLSRSIEHIAAQGGGGAVLWVFQPTEHDDSVAARAGFHRTRDLLQMRVRLPIREVPAWPPGITVRAFEPGHDEAAWLTVNNRAFSNHPEQGGWIETTLRRRMHEPWFDPDGFLLAFAGDELAGFCWTKVHAAGADDERFGEIFVIGVDPCHQGTGLGRALVVAGLESLASRGLSSGVLYVDAANTAAVHLYRALGFVDHRRDRAYGRAVP